MKGLVISSDDQMYVKDFGEPLFRTVGSVVDGYIETVKPVALPDPYIMIVNEEGLIRELPENLTGSLLYGTPVHGYPIVGNIVIMQTGFVNGEHDIIGVDDSDIAFLSQMAMSITDGLVTWKEK